ncbi:Inositol 2-dehydrogenase [Sedimentisphaera cyanobacteriorum]|uniref:Inositol 2-dehydrogenase n=1 Tax=Sedimentisphaera cyanobacteriorum TaxID=1940790 RepID=A0A1Q2HS18_9BACT|nr:Gfo/Idh/MocA family oxidoreductase [Sedimentisphaera cyanobacteriorum]AQQ10258.1 Inositol 2-dehydrogenase [Sedimentisphaera cyanobacteriorum]
MDDKKTRIGVVGCGKRVEQVLQGFLNITDNVQITAICDPSKDSIESFCKKFSIMPVVYEDHRALSNSADVDWVMVGSWNCFHLEHVKAAFEAGKNVFCEKPLATNASDCIELYNAWKASSSKFMIGFTLRYSPHYQKIKEVINLGIIGNPISLEFNETLDFNHGGYIMGGWRSQRDKAGTHLLEKCCHDMDVVNWLIQSRPVMAASFGGLDVFKPENSGIVDELKCSADNKKPFHSWGQTANPFTNFKDLVDNQVAIIQYQNGTRATFHTNCCSGIPERRMYIIGDKGCIRSDAIEGKIEYRRIGFDEEFVDVSTSAKGSHAGGDEYLCKCLKELFDGESEPQTSMYDAIVSAATCFGIDAALDEGCVYNYAGIWQQMEDVFKDLG